MLRSLVKNLFTRASNGTLVETNAPLRLHIGGQIAHPDWKILDVHPGPHVDFVGTCTDLSRFRSGGVTEIYASHVIEHLGYQAELRNALNEFHRVLAPGGRLRVSVPDLATLCHMFVASGLDDAERFHVMRMMFGGQIDSADFHRVGLDESFLRSYLSQAGFVSAERVKSFGLFQDASTLVFKDRAISLNMQARKS
jgi:predicted SAM-dependent methyltransferase